LFASKNTKSGIVFIIEDNGVYAKTLAEYLKGCFSEIKEVKIFPVGETCLLELAKNPDLIIIDYFLDSKYPDAETGLEIVKKIRLEKPQTPIILLSSQQEIAVAKESIRKYNCTYIKKDQDAYTKVEAVIKEQVVF
jgi:two-component system OmpR family response regulator